MSKGFIIFERVVWVAFVGACAFVVSLYIPGLWASL